MVGQPAKRVRGSAGGALRVPVLVILDMNGVLLLRPRGGKEAELRPHLSRLLATLDELVLSGAAKIAVWSSMMSHNLHPLVDTAFGESAANLEFVWDQQWCTEGWVEGMRKPLYRKDLHWLRDTWWREHLPDRVLLVDDDPIKCTSNPEGTAVHPASFTGLDGDTELLRLSAYLKALASSDCRSAREYVLANPYETFEEPAPPPRKKRRRMEAGAAVEAWWPDDELPSGGEWLPATVVKVLNDGSIDVSWDEDRSESTLPPSYVRSRAEG